jgi:hypothetical protein
MLARKLTLIDWLVLADIVASVLLCIGSAATGSPPSATVVHIAYALAAPSCVLLLVWMWRGGAESPLWNWLPPFWPWGRSVQSSAGRWLVVLAMVAGTAIGGTLQWLRS